jgi:hypothetical protein
MPDEEVKTRRTRRRQHREGAIKDSSSDHSLEEDEASKQPVILECRREWRDGRSEDCWTYYIQPLLATADVDRQQPACNYYPNAIPDEAPERMLDENSKLDYERPRRRSCRHYHHEEKTGLEPKPSCDCILAKTNFRTCNLSAFSYFDIVNYSLPRRRALAIAST